MKLNTRLNTTIVYAVLVILGLGAAKANADIFDELSDSVTIEDLSARADEILAQLILIEREAGVAHAPSLPVVVKQAGTREVFIQAMNVAQKTQKIAFELTRKLSVVVNEIPEELGFNDIYAVMSTVQENLSSIGSSLFDLDINEISLDANMDHSLDRTFGTLWKISSMLNAMSLKPISGAAIYQTTTLAINRAERLIDHFNTLPGIPNPPDRQPRQTVVDTFQAGIIAYQHVQGVFAASNLNMMQLGAINRMAPTLEDTYDLMFLISHELEFLLERLPIHKAPAETYYPGRKFPSDMVQRIKLLSKQLENLTSLIGSNDKWMTDAA